MVCYLGTWREVEKSSSSFVGCELFDLKMEQRNFDFLEICCLMVFVW